jgi:hypothetical protein
LQRSGMKMYHLACAYQRGLQSLHLKGGASVAFA